MMINSDKLLVYTTPEKIIQHFDDLLKLLYEQNKLKWFVIDEIHTVKTWGEDFREAYLWLSRKLKKDYPNTPILGLSATAILSYR